MRSIGIVRTSALVTALALAACQDAGTGPGGGRANPDPGIMDAAHDAAANPDFFFLPPLVPDPSADPDFDVEGFDAALTPVVEVCQSDGTACLPAAAQTDGFPLVSGSDPLDAVSVSLADQHYHLNWHTDRVVLNSAVTYRIRVLVAGAELGYADVDVVGSGREVKNVATDAYIPLVDGRTLPIKFRIERGAVFVIGADGGTVSAMGGAVALVFPPGAVSGSTGITVLPAAGFPADPDVVPGTVFDFGPDGAAFAEPVQMTIRYDPALIPPGGDEAALVLGHVVNGAWTVVAGSTVDVDANTVSGPVQGFSVYGLIIQPLVPPPTLSASLAFQSARDGDNEIFTFDGTTLTQLTGNTAADDAPDWIGGRIAWSSRVSGDYEIWVMDAIGGGAQNLTNSTGSNEFGPKWSPDGCRIAFVRQMAGGDYDVWVMKADGSEQVNLTNNPASDAAPAWSPDGARIAFNSDRDGNQEIYVMNADGSGSPTRLTNDAGNADASPDWSPDGTEIVFSKYVAGTFGEIWIVGADGSNPRGITTSNGTLDYGPAWSPDGSRIAFERYTSLPSGQTDIWLVNPDGSGLVALVTNPARDGAVAWQRPAPPELVSQETRITTTGNAAYPRLGADATGEIVVFTSGSFVAYRRLNADGTPNGAVVQVGAGYFPDISGSRIVYTSSSASYNRVMLHDIGTGVTSTILDAGDVVSRPRIDGDAVVWLEGNARVMYYDLTWAPGTTPVALAGPDPAATWADIGSRYVVWARTVNGQGDIHAYDRLTGAFLSVSADPAVDESFPRTSGNWVVWQAGGSIRLANLSVKPVTPFTVGDGFMASIDGDLMTYRGTGPGGSPVLMVYRISTGTSLEIPAHVDWSYFHDLRGDKVAYVSEWQTSTTEVYVSRLKFSCDVSCTGCGVP